MPRKSSNLSVIPPSPEVHLAEPPGALGKVGRSLWDDIVSVYEFNDRASYETLFQAACSADRAARLRELIDQDGEVLRTKAGLKDHPALRHEIACRSFVVRTLARLGCDLEPIRDRPGRPSSGSQYWDGVK